jgi:putative membrane protein insertion efficiency factor
MSPSLPALGLLGLIQIYKWTLSPFLGQGCRYKPTCSSYAADAIRMHGAWAGSWMAGARLCRCAPWGGHGWDPAPREIRTNSWWRPWRYGDWKGGYRAPRISCPASGGRVSGEANDDRGATAQPSDAAALPLSHAARDSSPARGGATENHKS